MIEIRKQKLLELIVDFYCLVIYNNTWIFLQNIKRERIHFAYN